MARTGNSWQLVMHLCAAWHHGLCQQHAKLILQTTFCEVSTMASTGILERPNLLMALGIYNVISNLIVLVEEGVTCSSCKGKTILIVNQLQMMMKITRGNGSCFP